MSTFPRLICKQTFGITFLLICLISSALLGSPRLVAYAAGSGANITLSPTSGPPTTQVAVQGNGFGADETVSITFDTNPVGSATTDNNGAFSAQITVPASALPGTHIVQATGQSSGLTAQANFLVQTDWSQFGFNSANTRNNSYENVLSSSTVSGLTLDWKALSRNVLVKTGYASPTVVNGVLYLGTYKGTLFALDAHTGKHKWEYTTHQPMTATAVVNGMVCFGSGSNLEAVDAQSGKLLWTTALDASPTTPVVANGIIYAGTGTYIYAVDAQSGTVLWTNMSDDITPAVANGVVYTGANTILYAFNAKTGKLLWQTNTKGGASQITVADGRVYAEGFNEYYFAVNAKTGKLLWQGPYGLYTGLATANGILYITNNGFGLPDLIAVNGQTGTGLWTFTAGNEFNEAPAVANGVVYVGGGDGNAWALDAQNGTPLWSTPVDSKVWLSSPIVTNGMVYLHTWSAIYAFHLPGMAS